MCCSFVFTVEVQLVHTCISENCDQKGQQTLQARRLEQNFQSDPSSCQEAPQRIRAAVMTIIMVNVASTVFSYIGAGIGVNRIASLGRIVP
jgi:hypothetical protein